MPTARGARLVTSYGPRAADAGRRSLTTAIAAPPPVALGLTVPTTDLLLTFDAPSRTGPPAPLAGIRSRRSARLDFGEDMRRGFKIATAVAAISTLGLTPALGAIEQRTAASGARRSDRRPAIPSPKPARCISTQRSSRGSMSTRPARTTAMAPTSSASTSKIVIRTAARGVSERASRRTVARASRYWRPTSCRTLHNASAMSSMSVPLILG